MVRPPCKSFSSLPFAQVGRLAARLSALTAKEPPTRHFRKGHREFRPPPWVATVWRGKTRQEAAPYIRWFFEEMPPVSAGT